jgi:hypothetical protein
MKTLSLQLQPEAHGLQLIAFLSGILTAPSFFKETAPDIKGIIAGELFSIYFQT